MRQGGNSSGVGQFTYSATAVDRAGNRRTVRATYRVTYRVDGFLPPLNNTGTMSVFRSGSLVPTAITLRRADGSTVSPVARPQWVSPTRGARTSPPVNEAVVSGAGTPGCTFVWRSNRWQYDWSTRRITAGYSYRIGVRLDDGTTRYLWIGVR